jgi:putative flippase GtrA
LSGIRIEFVRFVINGVVATAVHYAIFALLYFYAGVKLAALANVPAVFAGIAISFVGNRRFVFRSSSPDWEDEAVRFALLYGAIALIHVTILFIGADVLSVDATVTFALATVTQVCCNYIGARAWVFSTRRSPSVSFKR